jgi:predicted ATPase
MVRLSSTIPRPFDSFIGREEELQAVKALLSLHRLVTLTGAPGIGKTRLAVRVAQEQADSFPEGVCFVALVDVTDPPRVPQAVAAALAVREQPDRSFLQTLTDSLTSRALLLVWDNCDYLVDGCRALAQALPAACPQVKILVTSRRSLDFPGEILHTVPPFGVPEASLAAPMEGAQASVVRASEAVQLFQQRAREKPPGFEITPKNHTAVAQICRRLDGIPLALELAAGPPGSGTAPCSRLAEARRLGGSNDPGDGGQAAHCAG